MNTARFRLVVTSTALFTGVFAIDAKDVLIQTTPPGATVSVDGRVLGKTPLNTTKKDIMPTWFTDGVITSAMMTFDLPLYEKQTRKFTEFRVPKLIEATLVRKVLEEHFENYLSDVPGLSEQTVASEEAQIIQSRDLDHDGAGLFLKGHVLVAYLGVTAEAAPMDLIRERAREMGAVVVLITSKDAGVKTEIREITTRSSGTVASSIGFATASTSTGQAIYGSGNTISFIPGRTSTQFVPFEQRQYDVQVAFWRRRKANELGAYTELIPAELRQSLQRNTGAYVVAVDEQSPAFFANLLVGDVIVGINGSAVLMPDDFKAALSQVTDGVVEIDVVRSGGQEQKIQLTIAQRPTSE